MNIFVANRRNLPINDRMEGLKHVLRQMRQGEIDALQTEVGILRKLLDKSQRREVLMFRGRASAPI